MTLIINWTLLAVVTVFFLLLLFSSIKEKEKRAVGLSLVGLVFNAGLWLGFIFFPEVEVLQVLNKITWAMIVLVGVISFLKFFPRPLSRDLTNLEAMDERDMMFARNHLQYHPDLAEKYYERHPEKKEGDRKIQEKPELGQPGHLYYDGLYSPVFSAAFNYLAKTHSATRGVPVEERKELDEISRKKLSGIIKEMGIFYGAVDVGITKLKRYHFYSHRGRHAETWGERIDNDHTTAIVIIVAMSIGMIKSSPTLPAILESSRQYVEAAKIATVISQYIRDLGYPALAHTDGNYEVLCVPLAVDAGLGKLGRLGLFMHPVYGPCVRISVVTTSLDLPPVEPAVQTVGSLEHFCKICKKCADNCPTQSITFQEEPGSRGFRHWSINQETCFSFWKNIGTDCAFCIRVCPYTKPDTLLHRLVRWYISRNMINQYMALRMDDWFYGRKHQITNKNPGKLFQV